MRNSGRCACYALPLCVTAAQCCFQKLHAAELACVLCAVCVSRMQISVIDGDAYNDTAPDPLATIMELHTSDEVGIGRCSSCLMVTNVAPMVSL
jgi:hypothetical protein